MTWAARRQTTRGEDMAYSLLGIFGVSMSLLYGEGGPEAFRRLQEEIVKTSNDLSIFAWLALRDPEAPRFPPSLRLSPSLPTPRTYPLSHRLLSFPRR
ncbi:hypothetical protein PG987_006866 [Apiospora arundinis]